MDALLTLAGALGLAASVLHSVLGELRVVRPSTAPTLAAKRVLHAIMLLSGVYWAALGAALLAAPFLQNAELRLVIAYTGAAVYLTAAAANAWAMNFKHFGWIVLGVAGLAAAAGA